ncbi:hypothetical protein TspCOW1_21090 [Thiohalobacter sp. COW1]|nr:glycosyltransferase [Thiohalobacter sp. COW1]BCO32006.1 hypothetical protein TspCOW1_21090 [Thiohalobacter sp. COW1]
MKILVVAEDFPPNQGGIAEYSLNLSNALAAIGHDLTVVTAHVEHDEKIDAAVDYEVIRIGQKGVRQQRLGLLFRWKANERFRKELHKLVDQLGEGGGPDLTIVTSVSEWARVPMKRGMQYAVCVHGGDALGTRTDLIRSLYRKLVVRKVLNRSRMIFVNSRFTADQISGLVRNEEKIQATYCGVSQEFSDKVDQARRELESETETEKYSLLMVCRLVPIKACDVVIRAVAELKGAYPGMSLDIAGDGPERESLERLVAELDVADSVRFRGYVSDIREKARLFAQASLIVQSGRIDPAEGRPEAFGLFLPKQGWHQSQQSDRV